MKYCLIIIAIIFATQDSYSQQQAKIDWGPEYKKDGGMFTWNRLIGNDDKYFYVLSKPSKDPEIYKYNTSGELVFPGGEE